MKELLIIQINQYSEHDVILWSNLELFGVIVNDGKTFFLSKADFTVITEAIKIKL